jgi:hypothetical protein
MFILSYNRRLAWVAIPAVLWALVGLSLALGITAPAGEGPRAGLRLGPPEGGLRLYGHVVSLTETADGLQIKLAVPDAPPAAPPELPAGIQVEFVVDRAQLRVRPRIELADDSQLREFPGGRYVVVTTENILLFGHGDLRVVRRPPDLADDRLYEWLERQQRRRGPPEERPRPPANGRRPPLPGR